jgi:glycosyltransferase involved in cell wall biosynthesis
MTRILVLGDLGTTGFGTVTIDLGQALLDLGVDVRFVSLNQSKDLPEAFKGRVIALGTTDGWIGTPKAPEEAEIILRRMDALFHEIDGWSPEAAIIIGDHASVDFSDILRFIPDGFPAFHYVPIEGIGLKPGHARIWQKMTPVAMSEFGADQIATVYPDRPAVVYHGVDTDAFYPVSASRPITIRTRDGFVVLRSKDDCKRFLGAMLKVNDTSTGKSWPLWQPGRVALFRHDANVPRKRWQSLFRSIAPVLDRNPEVDLIYHTRTIYQGGDLEIEKSAYPVHIQRRMLSTGLHDAGAPVDRPLLCAMLNASDIYVSPAAEGFGLCIAEALACGVPAVGMDYSSVTEVIGKAGILVPPAGLIDNIYSSFWAGVREDLFGHAVEQLATSRKSRRYLGSLGPIHVGALFRWSKAAEQFVALIDAKLGMQVAA